MARTSRRNELCVLIVCESSRGASAGKIFCGTDKMFPVCLSVCLSVCVCVCVCLIVWLFVCVCQEAERNESISGCVINYTITTIMTCLRSPPCQALHTLAQLQQEDAGSRNCKVEEEQHELLSVSEMIAHESTLIMTVGTIRLGFWC